MPSSPAPDWAIPAAGEDGGQQMQMMGLLQTIAAAVERGGNGEGGEVRMGRMPPPVQRVQWSAEHQDRPEGFASGASPSLNRSSIAGSGGASSRRGYGTYGNTSGPRYLNPEGDREAPR